jgi:hypothetical protein
MSEPSLGIQNKTRISRRSSKSTVRAPVRMFNVRSDLLKQFVLSVKVQHSRACLIVLSYNRVYKTMGPPPPPFTQCWSGDYKPVPFSRPGNIVSEGGGKPMFNIINGRNEIKTARHYPFMKRVPYIMHIKM